MFISKSQYFKLRKALQNNFISSQDSNYEAWDKLDEKNQDLIDKADRKDDDWGVEDHEIEWDANAGNKNQVGLVVHTSVCKSEIEESEGNTESELYDALQRYGKKWAEKEIEMMENKLEKQVEELTESTLLAEREAEAYILTEELGYTIQEAADEMNVGFGRVSGARSRIKEKIRKAEKTAELSI